MIFFQNTNKMLIMSKKIPVGVDVLKDKIKRISGRAGVYRMISAGGNVLYVGKAKNLKKRLTNYTHLDKLSIRIRQMVEQVADLIVIETPGETEALILENDLIKQYRPYYNVLLKDDKSFPFILITSDFPPRLQKYRGHKNIKGDYYGPFASGLAVNKTITEIQKVFGLRTCPNTYYANRTRPCLLYQIGRCTGPCCDMISKEGYMERVAQTKAFLRGEKTKFQDILLQQMNELAAQMRYEEAAAVRDKIQFLNQIQSTDAQGSLGESDIIALYREGAKACIQIFFYRSDKASGNVFYMLENTDDESEAGFLSSFILQFYDTIPAPKHIYVSHKIEDGLAEALSQKAGYKIAVSSGPFKSLRKKLMQQALINAAQTFKQQVSDEETKEQTWNELRELLGIETLDKVEVYDNSHIQGASAVGAMIAANMDGFQKNWYRRYNITGLYNMGTKHNTSIKSNAKSDNHGQMEDAEARRGLSVPGVHDALSTEATVQLSMRTDLERFNDDFGMMREVLTRRLTRGMKENDLPSAMIIDGGKGQLSSVMEIFDELGVKGIALMSVAKGEKRNAGKETLYLSTAPTTPINLDEKSNLQHLIQRLRDEAHRFAIGTHRQKRAKNMFHETLKDIEGIGNKRKKDLMAHFGSVREIAGASIAQLMRVPGISEKIAKKVYTFYHG